MPFDMSDNGRRGGGCKKCEGKAFVPDPIPFFGFAPNAPAYASILSAKPCPDCNYGKTPPSVCPFCYDVGVLPVLAVFSCGADLMVVRKTLIKCVCRR